MMVEATTAGTTGLTGTGTATVDPSVALALCIAGVGAILFYLWSSKNTSSSNSKSGGAAADRIADSIRHSDDDVDIDAVVAECKASGRQPWKDPTFGHDSYPGNSIGSRNLELRDGERGKPLLLGQDGVTWQPPSRFAATSRPMGVRGDGVPTWLYSDNDKDGVVSAAESMETDDIQQGSVGDCYFLAALSAVVQHHPDLSDDLIDETYEEQGIYGVSFWRRGRWRMTWVDSYFPCYRPSSNRSSRRGNKYRLIFAGATDRKEIWPLVVEKAYAKVAGSYEAISGGHVAMALEMLTGGKGRQRVPATIGTEWEKFKEEVKSDEYFVGAGSQHLQAGAANAAEQKKTMKGIVTGHAYSILNVYEDEGLRLVELRNPWGRGEWTGDWGPGSQKWDSEEGCKVISVVGRSHKGDGRFWMAWEDFVECFDTVDSCYMNFTDEDRARRAALKEEAARIIAKQDRPESGAAAGGGSSGQPEYTRESADAMMAQLLAEEAREKRMKQIGARGNKKNAKKKRN